MWLPDTEPLVAKKSNTSEYWLIVFCFTGFTLLPAPPPVRSASYPNTTLFGVNSFVDVGLLLNSFGNK